MTTGEIKEYQHLKDVESDGFKPKEVNRVLKEDRVAARGYHWYYK